MRLILMDSKNKTLRDVHVPDEFAEFGALEFNRIADYIGRIITLRGLSGLRSDKDELPRELRDESARRRAEMPSVPNPRRKLP